MIACIIIGILALPALACGVYFGIRKWCKISHPTVSGIKDMRFSSSEQDIVVFKNDSSVAHVKDYKGTVHATVAIDVSIRQKAGGDRIQSFTIDMRDILPPVEEVITVDVNYSQGNQQEGVAQAVLHPENMRLTVVESTDGFIAGSGTNIFFERFQLTY